jgi:3-dehydroquinate dehydratase
VIAGLGIEGYALAITRMASLAGATPAAKSEANR